jgi:hypothetical protein
MMVIIEHLLQYLDDLQVKHYLPQSKYWHDEQKGVLASDLYYLLSIVSATMSP